MIYFLCLPLSGQLIKQIGCSHHSLVMCCTSDFKKSLFIVATDGSEFVELFTYNLVKREENLSYSLLACCNALSSIVLLILPLHTLPANFHFCYFFFLNFLRNLLSKVSTVVLVGLQTFPFLSASSQSSKRITCLALKQT